MTRIISGTLLLALAFLNGTSAAQDQPLFQKDAALKAVLTAPISQTYAQRHQEVRLYQPGQWTYIDDDGQTQRLDVSIRTRGHFRREYCQFPPLQLNFKKKQVRGTLFAGQNKMKVVAPCKNRAKYQQYVVLEYLSYRTFQIVTDHGYKTRLIRLTYVDSDEQLEPRTDFVFVIEDDSDMANRLGLDRINVPTIEYDELDHSKTAMVQIFQLLIANNDYSVLQSEPPAQCCHNIDVLGYEEIEGQYIPIPFDFDMSGMVNADYAAPPGQAPIEDVRQRYYRGLCLPTENLNAAIAHVQSKRDEIIALYENSAELNAKNKAKSLEYIGFFFNILDDPKRVQREIVGRCRGEKLLEKMNGSTTDST